MANPLSTSPVAALGEMGRLTELRKRFFFLLGGLIVYRIGTYIPVPGIDPVALARFFQDQQGTILSMFNMFSGGALQRLSIMALGVMPYISASIIVQMMAVVVPQLQALRKEGESGRRKLTQYTRYGTVFLATLSLYIFGGGPVNDFAFAFLVGILTGTYSSIYIATAIVLWWHKGERPNIGSGQLNPASVAQMAKP